jgi:hypothetical protein
MALVSLDEARAYLRVDSHDEDALIGILLKSAQQLCADVARLSASAWEEVNGDETESEQYTKSELEQIRAVMRVAVLYALGYLFEHREDADHHDLTITLRSLLFAVREGVL